MKTVLAPIDFSPVSEAVIYEAIALAQGLDARVVLLHVVPPPPRVSAQFGPAPGSEGFAAECSEAAGRTLRTWQRKLQAEGFTVHAVHVVGAPGAAIVEQAERLDANFIVMGTRGHGALYNLMIGSTAALVLKRARQPVLLLPPETRPSPARRRAFHALANRT